MLLMAPMQNAGFVLKGVRTVFKNVSFFRYIVFHDLTHSAAISMTEQGHL